MGYEIVCVHLYMIYEMFVNCKIYKKKKKINTKVKPLGIFEEDSK